MEDWRKPILAIFIDFNEVKYTQQGLPVSLPELSRRSGFPPDLVLLSLACTACLQSTQECGHHSPKAKSWPVALQPRENKESFSLSCQKQFASPSSAQKTNGK